MSKKVLLPLTALLTSFLLFFLALEAVLQVGALPVRWNQNKDMPTPDFANPNEIRIICLGESTTANTDSSDSSASKAWPHQLERMLNSSEKQKTFKVYNIAAPGISTSYEKFKLFEDIEDFKPHAVISMMGINDFEGLEYVQGTGFKALKTIKFLHWLKLLYTEHERQEEFKKYIDVREQIHTSIDQLGLSGKSGWKEVEIQILAQAEKIPENLRAVALKEAGIYLSTLTDQIEIQNPTMNLKGWAKQGFECAGRLAQKSHLLNPFDDRTLVFLIDMSQKAHLSCSPEVVRLLSESLQLGHAPSPTLAHKIPSCYKENPHFAQKMLMNHNIQWNQKKDYYNFTRQNYIDIAQRLAEKKILYLAMQYPTGTLDSLKNIFAQKPKTDFSTYKDSLYYKNKDFVIDERYQHVVFVSNENFNELLKSEKRSDYFWDQFVSIDGKGFGHTTELGSAMIAQNAKQALIESLSLETGERL